MDERRHNMDGALFVDEERTSRGDERRDGGRARHAYDDGKADAARRVTQGILDRMDLEATVHVREDDERVVLDLEGPDAGRAIGKKGMTLEALQFLVNKIVNRDPDERRHIVLDSGDYRERHDNGLISMAKREAKRAITSGRAVTLEPMSARDRRVIHVSLAKFPGVSTRSEGEGMDRRLQIIPVRGERGGRDDRGRDERRDRPAVRDERGRGPARRDRPPADDARRSDPDTGRRSDVEPRRSDVEPRRSDVEPRRSDVEPRRSDIEPRRSDIEPRRSDIEPRRGEGEPRRERDASRSPAPTRGYADDRDVRPARSYDDARDVRPSGTRTPDDARAPLRDGARAPARDGARDARAPLRDDDRDYTRREEPGYDDRPFEQRDRLDRGRGR